jgi:nicotinamidase/pyrazinamidase
MIRINTATTASFDVDVQNGFTPVCPNELPVPGGDEIAPILNAQAKMASFRIGSKDAHSPQAIWIATTDAPILSPIMGDNVDVHWPSHCVPGTKGFELIEGLPHPALYDYFVWKGVEPDMHPYGACYHNLQETMSTGVIEYLKNKGVQTVIVGGLATDYCVKNTVLQLCKAGFHTIVNLSACRGINARACELAISQMRDQGAVIIDSLQELAAE